MDWESDICKGVTAETQVKFIGAKESNTNVVHSTAGLGKWIFLKSH